MKVPLYKPPKSTSLLDTVLSGHKELGDLFRLSLGQTELYCVCSPDLAYEVLVKQKESFTKISKPGSSTGLGAVLGQGLLTNTDRSLWLKRRRALQPSFQQKRIEAWTKAIVQAGEKRLVTWKSKNCEQLDLRKEMLSLGQEIIYKVVFSLEPKAISSYPLSVPLNLATARASHVRAVNSANDKTVFALLTKRQLERTEGQRYGDLLGDLLDLVEGGKLAPENLRDELLTVFAAGLETVANALSWVWYLLSEHPEIYDRCIKEVGVLKGRSLEATTISQLSYLGAVFKETLRLYPTIPFAPRNALQDVSLHQFHIPKNARVMVSIYAIHRSEATWQDPNDFKPERFLEDANFPAYMPFGLGERICIGQHLAALQGRLLMAVFISSLRFKVHSSPATKLAISLAPKSALKAKLIWH